MFLLIKKLRFILDRKDKNFTLLLAFFSVFISVMETFGISIIMPFVSLASNFSLIDSNKYYNFAFSSLNFSSKANFVVFIGMILILFYILRSAINLFYQYILAKFSMGRYHKIAYRLFENYMQMSYQNFVQKNTSTLTKSIINEANNLTQMIQQILFIMSELFVVLFLYSVMLYVNYKITFLLSVILLVNALFLTKVVSKKIKKEGERREGFQAKFYEIINRSFGNFKLIKLRPKEEKLFDDFEKASAGFARVNIINVTLGNFPRLFLEAISFGLVIFIISYWLFKYQTDIKSNIPVISMFVLALYRLMPSVNRIMTGYNSILFNYKSLDIVHSDLIYDTEKLGNSNIEFKDAIYLKNLSFEYEKNNLVIENFNLKINKGEKIAFTGESGSGKSTLVDLIIGLYKPTNGEIYVDNQKLTHENIQKWREKIGYIPQNIYLFDGTVADNVTFGRKHDEAKVIDVLKKANIYNFLDSKAGIQTKVGEGGIMLSGGQKQRIAIARALYGDPEILVLDEATSALDNETEKLIMDEIYKISSDKTLIIVAHRLSTTKRCDKIYNLEDEIF